MSDIEKELEIELSNKCNQLQSYINDLEYYIDCMHLKIRDLRIKLLDTYDINNIDYHSKNIDVVENNDKNNISNSINNDKKIDYINDVVSCLENELFVTVDCIDDFSVNFKKYVYNLFLRSYTAINNIVDDIYSIDYDIILNKCFKLSNNNHLQYLYKSINIIIEDVDNAYNIFNKYIEYQNNCIINICNSIYNIEKVLLYHYNNLYKMILSYYKIDNNNNNIDILNAQSQINSIQLQLNNYSDNIKKLYINSETLYKKQYINIVTKLNNLEKEYNNYINRNNNIYMDRLNNIYNISSAVDQKLNNINRSLDIFYDKSNNFNKYFESNVSNIVDKTVQRIEQHIYKIVYRNIVVAILQELESLKIRYNNYFDNIVLNLEESFKIVLTNIHNIIMKEYYGLSLNNIKNTKINVVDIVKNAMDEVFEFIKNVQGSIQEHKLKVEKMYQNNLNILDTFRQDSNKNLLSIYNNSVNNIENTIDNLKQSMVHKMNNIDEVHVSFINQFNVFINQIYKEQKVVKNAVKDKIELAEKNAEQIIKTAQNDAAKIKNEAEAEVDILRKNKEVIYQELKSITNKLQGVKGGEENEINKQD